MATWQKPGQPTHLALSVRFTVAGRPVEYSQEIARQAAEVLTGMGAGQVEVKLASSSARMSTYSYAVTVEVHAELDYRPCPPGDRVPPIPMGRPAKPPRSERKAVRCSECGEVIDNAMGSNVRTHTICAKLVEQHARSQSPELAPGGADCPAGELAEVPG